MDKSWEDDWKKAPGNTSGHYNGGIQPIEYFASDFSKGLSANVIKYVVRHYKKGGKEDLDKARWYVDWLNRSLGYREIHAGDYIASNRFDKDVQEIVLLIEQFEDLRESDVIASKAILKTIDNHIVELIKKYYE